MYNELYSNSVYDLYAGYLKYAEEKKSHNEKAVSFFNYALGRF